MPANIVDLTGDYPSESLMEYLITSPRPKPKVPNWGHNHLKTEIIDLTADAPTLSSMFGGSGVVDSQSDYDMIDSTLIKTEPGVVELTRDSIIGFPSRFSLHLLDSIPEDPSPSSLYRLPPEIRLIVHGYVLTAPPDVTLRIRDESPLTQRFPIFDVTAIIRTSKEICAEAKAVFYSTNRFHHDMDEPFFRWPTPFFVNLPFMKHVSLSYIDDYPASLAPNEKFAHSIDRALGSLITELPELAPNLRTFTLYVFSIPGLGVPYEKDLIRDGTRTATALRNLQTQADRLSILTFGPPTALQKLRDIVALPNSWCDNVLVNWPQFDVPMMQHCAIVARLGIEAEERVRAWHIYNAASKACRISLEWERELFGGRFFNLDGEHS